MEHDTTNSTTEQTALQETYRQIWERKSARRRRERRRRFVRAAIGMTLAFGLGFLAGAAFGSREPTPSAPAVSTQGSAQWQEPEYSDDDPTLALPPPTATLEPVSTETPGPPAPILNSVPLDAETQLAIYGLCDGDPDLFCAVMAIAKKESEFKTNAVGDGGNSIGMMQINTPNHAGRIAALGVTDLTDPVQCALVAIDYIRELSTTYGFGWVDGHQIYMAYNAGPGNARKAIQLGMTSNSYSREVLALYEGYAAEIGGQE